MPGGRIDLSNGGRGGSGFVGHGGSGLVGRGRRGEGRPGPEPDPVGWFVRRAGLARFTTFTCAGGLALTAVTGARPVLGVGGLMAALAGGLLGLFVRHSRRWSWVLLVSVLLTGLFAGYLAGSSRVAALTGGHLQSRIGSRVEAELVVTGSVRVNSGWQSATAVVRSLRVEGANAAPGVTGTEGATVGAVGATGAAVDATVGGPPAAVGAGPAVSAPDIATAGQDPSVGESVWLEVAPPDADAGPVHFGAAPSDSVLQQGMIVVFKGTIEAPEGPSASGYDQARQLLHQGIEVVFAARDPSHIMVVGRRGGVTGWFDRLRASARDHLSQGPSARVNEALKGVVLGDASGIDKGWMEAFRRSGTAHMLSVSGLHVGSIAGIVIGLARLLGAARWVGFLLAAFAAVLMIPFVGAAPPIVRAAVMIVIVLTGRWVGRGRDQWQVLALAAVVILALNPFALFDVGFQLSFSAFVGMLALTAPLQRLFRRLPQSVGSSVAVSVAASLGTTPVALAVFDRTSLVSPLANLLVVPLLPAVTGLGMASVFLGFAWSGLSTGLDTLASLPMTWTVLVSRLMALAPVLGRADLGCALGALVVGAALLPTALALMGRSVRTPFGIVLPVFRRSLSWLRLHRPRSRRWAAALGLGVVGLGLVAGAVAYPLAERGVETLRVLRAGRDWPEQVEVRVLDIGQGNAVLVRTPDGRALLFDGGPAGCDLAAQLRSLGVRRLDLVVISHPHADHFAGLLEGLEGVEVEALIDHVRVDSEEDAGTKTQGGSVVRPGSADGESGEAGDYLRLRRELEEEGCCYLMAATGYTARLDRLALRLFAPERPLTLVDGADPWAERGGTPTGDELNGASVVAMVSVGEIDVLIPGDAEADVLQRYDLPPAEVLLVPHHGSRGAVSDGLLSHLQPKAAIISVGEDNTFGHPYAGTETMLRRSVPTVLRTDTAGWVSCTVKEDALVITTERKPAP